MSERIAATIWIGGKVPASLVSKLCGEITAASVALEWGGELFAPKTGAELLEACIDSDGASVLFLCDEEASWGQFESLEEFLQRHDIPFTRSNDGGIVYDGEVAEYRPGMDILRLPTNTDGKPIVAASQLDPVRSKLASAIEELEKGSTSKATSMLRDAFQQLSEQLPPEIAPLESFEIIND